MQILREQYGSSQARHLEVPGGPFDAMLWKTRHALYSLVDTQLLLFILSPLSSKMKEISQFMRKQ